MTARYEIPKYSETIYDTLLQTQASQHGAMLRESDYVTIRAISYPHWEKVCAVPIWIIDPKLTKIREEYPSDLPKLKAQNLLHLCNEDLAEHSHGFELHSAQGRRSPSGIYLPYIPGSYHKKCYNQHGSYQTVAHIYSAGLPLWAGCRVALFYSFPNGYIQFYCHNLPLFAAYGSTCLKFVQNGFHNGLMNISEA